MASARFLRVEVFTDTPGRGNPAGVIVASAPVGDRAARAWAERMALPGHGFAWPAGETAWHARFHTPGSEVTLSGHTALATAHALRVVHELGDEPVSLITRHTTLEIERTDGTQWLALPLPRLAPSDIPRAAVATVLGLREDDLRAEVPLVATGDTDLLIPLRPAVDLVALKPDLDALGALAKKHALRGFCTFTTKADDAETAMNSRFFAPHIGLNEDIATGSVHGPLAVHVWSLRGRPAEGEFVRVIGGQGEALGRPCRIAVELRFADGAIDRVRVGGASVTLDDHPLGPVETS